MEIESYRGSPIPNCGFLLTAWVYRDNSTTRNSRARQGAPKAKRISKNYQNPLFKRLNLLVFDGFEGKSVLNHRFRAQIL